MRIELCSVLLARYYQLINPGLDFLQGRVVEIYGPEASGKTTLALHVIAEAQKQGG